MEVCVALTRAVDLKNVTPDELRLLADALRLYESYVRPGKPDSLTITNMQFTLQKALLT